MGCSRSRPGPRAAASVATPDTRAASNADNASSRHISPTTTGAPPRARRTAIAAAATDDTGIVAALNHATRAGSRRMTSARTAATKGGASRPRTRIRSTYRCRFSISRCVVNVVHDGLHHEHAEQHVEEHAKLDDERHTIGAEQRQQRDAVLEHEEPDNLRNRLAAAHDDEQAHEDERERDRKAAARRKAHHLGQRP